MAAQTVTVGEVNHTWSLQNGNHTVLVRVCQTPDYNIFDYLYDEQRKMGAGGRLNTPVV